MHEPQISAVIIARDEEHDLDACLDSLTWVDEVVIVVDARSQDGTEAIARRRATCTIVREFDHFASQRNAGIDRATGRWILSIDADERISEGLRLEIMDLIQDKSNSIQAARIPIQSEILGRTLRYCGTQLDRPIRLFQRTQNRWQGEVHERVQPTGQVGSFESPILHRSLSDLNEFMNKIHDYTSLEAEKLARLGTQPRRFDLTLRPIWTFLKLYIARLGFLDGTEGFLYCALSGVSVFVRNAKLRERILARTSVGDLKPLVRVDQNHGQMMRSKAVGKNPSLTRRAIRNSPSTAVSQCGESVS